MALDARGVPTHACPKCGCMVFSTGVMFENYEVALYFLDGKCYDCETMVTLPTPLDKPQ